MQAPAGQEEEGKEKYKYSLSLDAFLGRQTVVCRPVSTSVWIEAWEGQSKLLVTQLVKYGPLAVVHSSDAPCEHLPAEFRYVPVAHSRHNEPEHFLQKGEMAAQLGTVQTLPERVKPAIQEVQVEASWHTAQLSPQGRH